MDCVTFAPLKECVCVNENYFLIIEPVEMKE